MVARAGLFPLGDGFWLALVGEPPVAPGAGEGFGSGGKRDLGFSESQGALVLYHAERTYGRLGLKAERR